MLIPIEGRKKRVVVCVHNTYVYHGVCTSNIFVQNRRSYRKLKIIAVNQNKKLIGILKSFFFWGSEFYFRLGTIYNETIIIMPVCKSNPN